jgi:type II secretory pathway component GspD/PulD (secretin)
MSLNASAAVEKTFHFNFEDAPLTKVLAIYSAQSGQKFVVDPNLGQSVKVTIVQTGKVGAKEAFNLLSASLSLSGVAVSDRQGTLVLASVRSMERSYIPVVTELPPLQPERLVTWVINLKNADGGNIVQQLRILTSKDGEMQSFNQKGLMITDWVSNLYRVRALLEQVDKEVAPPTPQAPDRKG